jgi:hypothetical protein
MRRHYLVSLIRSKPEMSSFSPVYHLCLITCMWNVPRIIQGRLFLSLDILFLAFCPGSSSYHSDKAGEWSVLLLVAFYCSINDRTNAKCIVMDENKKMACYSGAILHVFATD